MDTEDVPNYVLPTSEAFAIRDAPSSSLRKEELLQLYNSQLYRKLGNLSSLHSSIGENTHAGKLYHVLNIRPSNSAGFVVFLCSSKFFKLRIIQQA